MLRKLSAFALALLLVGCASLPEELPLGPPGHALAPQPGGPLAEAEAALQARVGTDLSGFHLLDANADRLRWRLAPSDSARHSLALHYSVWWGDVRGSLLLRLVVAAAAPGDKVRTLVAHRPPNTQ